MKIGADSISLRLGSVEIPKAYLGSELVYSEEPKNYIGVWRDGYKLGSQGKSMIADSTCMLTPYFKVKPNHTIIFQTVDYTGVAARDLTDGFSSLSQSLDYWNQNAGRPKTFVTNGNTRYLIVTVSKSMLSTAYIKDNTTGEYIWKGDAV